MRIIFIYNYIIKPKIDRRLSFVVRKIDDVIHAFRNSKHGFYCNEEFVKRFEWMEELPLLSTISDEEEFKETLDKFEGKEFGGGVIVTAHWLTYIFDIQEKVEYIWSRFPIFYFMAFRLLSDFNYERIKRDLIKSSQIMDVNINMSLKHRLEKKHKFLKALLRTMKKLAENKNSLPEYLSRAISISSKNWIKQVAISLSYLSFNREPRKRTWSALKDWICEPIMAYLLWNSSRGALKDKMSVVVNKPISEWEENIEQLELPGDEWNKRFIQRFKRVIAKYRMKSSARKGIRKLYEKLNKSQNNLMKRERLFPIYLDISFTVRGDLLTQLIKKSSTIIRRLEMELGNYTPIEEHEIIEAYKLIRREFTRMDSG